MPSISELYSELQSYGRFTPEYWEKMMHAIPDAPVVERLDYILDHCRAKTVMNCGSASGQLHELIRGAATHAWGLDREGEPDYKLDFEDFAAEWPDIRPDLIVAGEILEHLSNPGWFLSRLKRYGAPVLITVPNAGSNVGRGWFAKHIEQVNIDHVSWYSWRTLKTLVERHGYEIIEWAWYNGRPMTAEGIIFLVK